MLPQSQSYREVVERFQWQIPERYNIGVDVCDKWSDADPQRLALLHKRQDGTVEQFTFQAIQKLANQTANLLMSYGIRQGDRVGILLPQAPETGYSHVALYKLGAIAVPLFTLFGVDALAYRLGNSGAKAVITDAASGAKLESIRTLLPDLVTIFIIDDATSMPSHYGLVDFHGELANQPEQFQAVDTAADDPAVIIYTSGTTGPPKGALHAHSTLLGHLPGVEISHNFFPQLGDRIWTPADWAWIGGLFDVLLPAWHHGVTVVSHRFEKFTPEAAFQLLADFQVRNAFLPPTALKMMRAIPNPEKQWPFQLRSIASGGETLGAELLNWGEQTFGLTINEFYGQTECNMIVSSCASLMPSHPGIMGRAVPGHELAIVDKLGNPLPLGQTGQIAARRPNPVMFLEYWQNPQATQEKFIGDWLLTGDMGVMDEAGYIRFIGRNDDLINSAGYRIGPGEIEDCLLSHPAVKLAAVVGVPDATRNEIIKAFIVLHSHNVGNNALLETIQQHVKTKLAAHEYPRLIEFVDELPMTTTGKIIRRLLRDKER